MGKKALGKLPRVEWALFCHHAERDGLGFLNLTQVTRTVPRVPSAAVGIPLWLAFGVTAEPDTEPILHLTFVLLNGARVTNSVALDMKKGGFLDAIAKIPPLVVDTVGAIRAEFSFDDDEQPRHVAILLVRDAPYSVPPAMPPGAAPTH